MELLHLFLAQLWLTWSCSAWSSSETGTTSELFLYTSTTTATSIGDHATISAAENNLLTTTELLDKDATEVFKDHSVNEQILLKNVKGKRSLTTSDPSNDTPSTLEILQGLGENNSHVNKDRRAFTDGQITFDSNALTSGVQDVEDVGSTGSKTEGQNASEYVTTAAADLTSQYSLDKEDDERNKATHELPFDLKNSLGFTQTVEITGLSAYHDVTSSAVGYRDDYKKEKSTDCDSALIPLLPEI